MSDQKDDLVLEISDDSESETQQEYVLRIGVIFIIDATEPMFRIDPDVGKSYFSQCLETYRNILSEKLSWNSSDWMGIVLMGTTKWDMDPEIKNVLTWQNFEQVSIEHMMKVEKALENIEKFHSEIGSSVEYPLHDALWHASRSFGTVKIKMPFRQITLLTCSDNPCTDNPGERNRIRIRAADYASLHIRLSVVGLGEEWNPEHFFAELELQSGRFKKIEDYQRTYLPVLEEEYKHPSKITNKLDWTIGEDVKLGVSVRTIKTKKKYPKTVFLKKENNEKLEKFSYYELDDPGYIEDDDEDSYAKFDPSRIVLQQNVRAHAEFGGRDIELSLQELNSLTNSREPGIELLGFKPQSRLDVSLHLQAPKFITYNDSEIEGSKVLFAALLNRCMKRNLMAICTVTFRSRSRSHLYAMIPSTQRSGFYAYKLPFAEDIRNIAPLASEHIYDESDNPCPINDDIVGLCSTFIKKTSFVYEPTMFSNPKLRNELAHIESLGLDKDSVEIPIDTTFPDKDAAHERLGEVRKHFEQEVRKHDRDKSIKRPKESTSEAPSKISKMDETLDFKQLVQDGSVEKCTVKQLKDYLKSVGLRTTGRKDELVKMVYDFNQ